MKNNQFNDCRRRRTGHASCGPKLLGRLLVSEGYDVKVSEVHGMSQRGGSVVTYVRFGEKFILP